MLSELVDSQIVLQGKSFARNGKGGISLASLVVNIYTSQVAYYECLELTDMGLDLI